MNRCLSLPFNEIRSFLRHRCTDSKGCLSCFCGSQRRRRKAGDPLTPSRDNDLRERKSEAQGLFYFSPRWGTWQARRGANQKLSGVQTCTCVKQQNRRSEVSRLKVAAACEATDAAPTSRQGKKIIPADAGPFAAWLRCRGERFMNAIWRNISRKERTPATLRHVYFPAGMAGPSRRGGWGVIKRLQTPFVSRGRTWKSYGLRQNARCSGAKQGMRPGCATEKARARAAKRQPSSVWVCSGKSPFIKAFRPARIRSPDKPARSKLRCSEGRPTPIQWSPDVLQRTLQARANQSGLVGIGEDGGGEQRQCKRRARRDRVIRERYESALGVAGRVGGCSRVHTAHHPDSLIDASAPPPRKLGRAPPPAVPGIHASDGRSAHGAKAARMPSGHRDPVRNRYYAARTLSASPRKNRSWQRRKQAARVENRRVQFCRPGRTD